MMRGHSFASGFPIELISVFVSLSIITPQKILNIIKFVNNCASSQSGKADISWNVEFLHRNIGGDVSFKVHWNLLLMVKQYHNIVEIISQ